MIPERLHANPFAMTAILRQVLVLTFAYPAPVLAPLVPPWLRLDTYAGCGFVAVAMVETAGLRPGGTAAWLGTRCFLMGYRIFCRYRRPDGKDLRGLRILGSFTDRRWVAAGGNRLTQYHYRRCRVRLDHQGALVRYIVATRRGEADVHAWADLSGAATAPPPGSPFPDLASARRFAGPLPFTFGVDAHRQRVVVVQGVRQAWDPLPVRVSGVRCRFLDQPALAGQRPILANAFALRDVPYRWLPGETHRIILPGTRDAR